MDSRHESSGAHPTNPEDRPRPHWSDMEVPDMSADFDWDDLPAMFDPDAVPASLPVDAPLPLPAEVEPPDEPESLPVLHAALGEDSLSVGPNPLADPLLRVAAHLAQSSSYADLLGKSTLQLVAALPAVQGAVLWLYDQRTSRLGVASRAGLLADEQALVALDDCQLYPGDALTGKAFQSGSLLHAIQRGQGHARSIPASYRAAVQALRAQSAQNVMLLSVPLRLPGETIGVLDVLHLLPADEPGQGNPSQGDSEARDSATCHLFRVLPVFAAFLANTLRTSQLYEQSQHHCRRLDAFDAVVTAISTATDLPDLLRSVLDVILNLLPISSGAIVLFDPAQLRLTLGVSHNLPPDYAEVLRGLPISGSPCEEVVRYGQPTLRPLIAERGEEALLNDGLESCAYLPLLAGGTVVGVLALYGSSNLYRHLQLSQLMPLGNQVGFAIANVRLYEESLLERHRLNTVVNSITEGVVLCDSQGRLMLTNEAAMHLLSLDAVPYQQSLSEMPDFYGIRDLDGGPLPVEQLPMARALRGETFHDQRVLIHGISGDNSVMSFSGAPARAESQNAQTIEGAVVVFRDITASQKLERAKDEFLAVAAHELRSPLAAVRAYSENLLRRERKRQEQDARDVRGLTILSEQVGHMLRMVDNLLDVSCLDAGQLDLQFQNTDLVQLVAQVLDQQRPATANHELELHSDHAELWVSCDPLRVRQVLTNLVSNAIKYSPAGTQVAVCISTRQVTPATPGVRVSDTGRLLMSTLDGTEHAVLHEAVIAVRDQGGGIEPEQQARLFERFYRVKGRRIQGLGLGLYLSREFVLMHGGSIWIESQQDQGSTFFFTLPMHG